MARCQLFPGMICNHGACAWKPGDRAPSPFDEKPPAKPPAPVIPLLPSPDADLRDEGDD